MGFNESMVEAKDTLLALQEKLMKEFKEKTFESTTEGVVVGFNPVNGVTHVRIPDTLTDREEMSRVVSAAVNEAAKMVNKARVELEEEYFRQEDELVNRLTESLIREAEGKLNTPSESGNMN